MDHHDAARRGRIVAAHTAGQSVTAIERHFGLPREDVERILAEAGVRPPEPPPGGYAPQGPQAAGYGPPEAWGSAFNPGPGHHATHLPYAGRADRSAQAPRPPWPVMVAAGLVGLYAVVSAIMRLGAGGFGAYQAGGLVSSAMVALVAYLLWKGRRGAWILALIFGTLGVVARMVLDDVVGAAVAAAVVLLLVIPHSARAWFSS